VSGRAGTPRSATAFAPATVANIAVGFDILGFAVNAVGDLVTVSLTTKPGEVKIDAIENAEGLPMDLPLDPAKNTSGLPLIRMLGDIKSDFGFAVRIKKGIPLGSGMGGSASSAVGAVVAANALLKEPLSKDLLLRYALEGEALASGARHADNLAPCLYGGLTLTRPGDKPDVVELSYPHELLCVLVHPAMRLDTKEARKVLSAGISLKTHVLQSANLASFLAGCFKSDFELIRRGLEDLVIEPQRSRLIPGFAAVKAAALQANALGCSISGAGPSVFALARDRATAEKIMKEMLEAFRISGKLEAKGWISPISANGAKIV
jgi:homoserine kinase